MKAAATIALLFALTFPAGSHAATRDAWNLSLRHGDDPVAATHALARSESGRARTHATDLRTERVAESLSGRHVFLREHLAGRPVLNAGFTATFDSKGTITSFHDRRSRATDDALVLAAREAGAIARAHTSREVSGEPTLVGWRHDDGAARLAWRVVTRSGYDEYATLVDAATGAIVLTEPLFVSVDAKIFDPNPVTALNQPSLRDNDDSASAVPDSAYTIVTLEGLSSDDSMSGAHVAVSELEAPVTLRAKPSAGLLFDRSQDEFEEVMVYAHIDRSQRYMQSLGFTGAKAIVPYAIPVDAHGVDGADNSYYRFTTPGRGRLVFGDGGVDDAEDADIILHEYGHAIQDSIVPAGFTGAAASEARAMGEGFGDYWAFSSSYAANVASGADAFCVGNWDALCGQGPSTECSYPPSATCLRRVDGTKTMADYIRSGGNGTEHRNGEIWSAALGAIFLDAVAMSGIDEGRRLADRTILESHFGMPPNPTYRTAAIRMLDADRRLNAGRLEPAICSAMTLRGILEDEECNAGLRGDVTMVQSPSRGTPIPDNTPAGVDSTLTISDTRVIESLFVAVDVRHPRRGDLRLTLTGPDATSAVLQTESSDSAADIVAVYGLDTQPSQPLTPFLGRSGAGTWTLNIVDNRGVDVGELAGWSLLARFQGDAPIADRGRPGTERLHVAVTGTTAGAAGTRFVSDLRILNADAIDRTATLLFSSSGTNGSELFKALTVAVPAGHVVALDDVVDSVFRSSGTGSIEVRGDPSLLVTSRIYNDQPEGSFGQFLTAAATSSGVTAQEGVAHVAQLRNTPAFRSNLGFAEIDGGSGEVAIRFFDSAGTLLSTESRSILPFSHLQLPLFGGIGGTLVQAARAEVRVVYGDARVVAYGSSVDNLSGDAVYVPGARLPRPASSLAIPAVIHADGAAGTKWRSDVWALNPGPTTVMFDLVLHPNGGSPSARVQVSLAAGEMRIFEDAVSGTFATAGTGSITVEGPELSSLVVTSRAWNDASGGSFGQFIEARPVETAAGAGELIRLTHLDHDDTFRTNVGITEVTGAPVTARVRILDAAGDEVFTAEVTVGPHQNRQLSLAQLGAPAVRNAQATIDILSGTGRALAYASVVDNRTGDAVYVAGR